MVWLWVWGIVTATALILEFITSDLVTIWFGAGGLVTLIVVAIAPKTHIAWQLVIFVGVSVALLLCTRKICKKLLKNDTVKTNIDAIVGTQFTVKDVAEQGYTYHTINGTSWRVQAVQGEKLETGSKYEVCDVKGNKLIAKKIEE